MALIFDWLYQGFLNWAKKLLWGSLQKFRGALSSKGATGGRSLKIALDVDGEDKKRSLAVLMVVFEKSC